MKKRQKIIKWLTFFLVLVLLVSGALFFREWQTSRTEEESFHQLQQLVAPPAPETLNTAPSLSSVEPEAVPEETSPSEEVDNHERFAPLIERNEHFIGWLNVPGTRVDYPVMHTPDYPQYYMSRDFDRNRSNSGTPFLDAKCTLSDNNLLIYGHNMHTGTMFADLLNYNEESFYKEHSTFSFETPEESAEYEIIAAFREVVHYKDEKDVFRYYNFGGELSEKLFNEYLTQIKAACAYEIEPTAQYGDKLITLSTCSKHVENGRFVVVGRKIVNET